MREIKFRGKTKEGEWVYGNLLEIWTPLGESVLRQAIVPLTCNFKSNGKTPEEIIEVLPETVSQYTGLKDKNGVEIYEGDRFILNNQGMTGYLFYEIEKMEWRIRCDNEGVNNFVIDAYGVENYKLIGNIHDK